MCAQVAVGDMVDVKRGAMADKAGTVKYIFQGSLFLHSRCVAPDPENCNAAILDCCSAGTPGLCCLLVSSFADVTNSPVLAAGLGSVFSNAVVTWCRFRREVKTHGGFFCVNARDTRVRGAKSNNYRCSLGRGGLG